MCNNEGSEKAAQQEAVLEEKLRGHNYFQPFETARCLLRRGFSTHNGEQPVAEAAEAQRGITLHKTNKEPK